MTATTAAPTTSPINALASVLTSQPTTDPTEPVASFAASSRWRTASYPTVRPN